MKKIKDLLNEFRNSGSGGGGGRNNDPSGGHFSRIEQFAESIPFTHITTGEHEITFHSANHALLATAHSLAKHEMGREQASKSGNKPMHEYFMASAGTHDDVLDALSHHIMNHPKLPYDLIDSVSSYVEHIQSEAEKTTRGAERMGSMFEPRMGAANTGEKTLRTHSHPDMELLQQHPHLHDDTHHLKNVIQELKDNPSDGYFLKSDETK
jgi:hypothetical protein